MALFSRKPSPARQAEAITRFWDWWRSEGAAATEAALAQGEPQRMIAAFTARVGAIHPQLGWELGEGSFGSEHVLMVTPNGDPALRPLARRWLLAAPGSDPVWEYADARRAMAEVDGATTVLGDSTIDLASAQAEARVNGATLDVTVFHPVFADTPDEQRTIAGFLLLDWALGETDVETWIGEVSTTAIKPLDAVPLSGLRAVVRQLREQFTDSDGEPAWVLMQGSTKAGGVVLASAVVPLRPALAPHLDTHVAVAVPYTDRTEQGLPGPGSLEPLRDLEEHLTQRLGGSGMLVAHETRAGVRVLHCYVDGTTPAAEQLRAAVGGWAQGRVRVESAADPGWDRVRHLRA